MVAVAGKLWCGCQNRVIVLNTATLVQEVGQAPHPEPGGAGDGPQRLRVASVWLCPPQHTLHVGQDSGRSVTCMVSAGPGVWVALQGSAQVRLYHATSYEQLAEADVTPPVHKMLAGKTPKFPFPGVFPIFCSVRIASLKNALLPAASAAEKCINILSQLQGPNPMSSASAFCSPWAAAKSHAGIRMQKHPKHR